MTKPTNPAEREATQWRKKPVVVTASQWFKNGVKSTEAAGFFSYSLQADSGYEAASTGHRISAEQYGAICRILATPPEGPQP